MRIEIRSHNIDRARGVCAHAERRLEQAIRRFNERILTAQVHIADVNGPRGGIDKRCRIHLQGRGLNLVVEGLGADAYAAVDDAIDRISRAVRRALDRGRTLHSGVHRVVEHLPA